MTSGAVLVANAGDDIGRALCGEICARGHPVAGLVGRPEELEAVAHLAGPLFLGLVCDLADPTAVALAVREVRDRLGGIGVLVNRAVAQPRRDILDETAESFLRAVDANLGSVVSCTREVLSEMVERGRGRILNVLGSADAAPQPASAAQAVSHEAVRAFSRSLVADLADRFPNIVVSDWIPRILDEGPDRSPADDIGRAARWGAMLALAQEPSLNGTTWIDDREMVPRRSIGRRAASWLYGGRPPAPRRLDPGR